MTHANLASYHKLKHVIFHTEQGIRALDKQEYLVIIRDNFCFFYIKTYVVTPHLNRLNETVQMRGHNICFRSKIRKIIIKYSLLSRALRYTLMNLGVRFHCL